MALKLLAACLLSLPAVDGLAQLIPQATSAKHVVLKNGRVFSGEVRATLSGYAVSRQGGVEVWLDRDQVDFAVEDLYEAYLRLKARIGLRDALGHVELARWCLRYGHKTAAQEQIDLLLALNTAPRATRQLVNQLEAIESKLETAASVAVTQPLTKLQTADNYVSIKVLEALVESLPTPVLATFNSRVQPQLINGCTAAKCHVAADAPMQLIRGRYATSATSRATQRNLFSVMNFVDFDDPLASPLLVNFAQPHAEMQKAVYELDSSHYQLMRDWVVALAASPAQRVVTVDPMVNPASFQSEGQPAAGPGVQEMASRSSSQLKPLPGASRLLPKDIQSTTGTKTNPPSTEEADEFDPSLFNREHEPPAPKKLIRPLPPVDVGKASANKK